MSKKSSETSPPRHWLLVDIGNTHVHMGLGDDRRVLRERSFPTATVLESKAFRQLLERWIRQFGPVATALCSVVPSVTPVLGERIRAAGGGRIVRLTAARNCLIGVDYPNPASIGPDRLANAVAAKHHYGAPVVVVDFGTAVTFDVVDRRGFYVGGIIAPGLSAFTDYLHERTALLPRVRIQEPHGVIGKSTREAMLIGAVHGYRGLIRGLMEELTVALKGSEVPLIATGGYGALIAERLSEIREVQPLLTLEGLRLTAMGAERG